MFGTVATVNFLNTGLCTNSYKMKNLELDSVSDGLSNIGRVCRAIINNFVFGMIYSTVFN